VKVIAYFSGCLYLRYAYEMGGIAFSASMVWAQIMPFVALQFFEGDKKETITIMLLGSFILWLLLNFVFFCLIDLSYLNTFFGTQTAPQYACELFLTSSEDQIKFKTAFKKNLRLTKSINKEVKEWVTANIERWKAEKEPWFVVEYITDEFLPAAAFEAEGGTNRQRRRSSVSLREIVGHDDKRRVHPN